MGAESVTHHGLFCFVFFSLNANILAYQIFGCLLLCILDESTKIQQYSK